MSERELPEDAMERRAFDQMADVHGGPLRAVVAMLAIWHSLAPVGGSYREQLAILTNEVRKAASPPTGSGSERE